MTEMSEIVNLEPKCVWKKFDDICSIPHPSKKEGRMSQYIIDFGKKLGLETISDEYGNILIRKPATKGHEDVPSILFQSHIDMVCEKNSDVKFDFDNQPIEPYIDGEWVKAKGTTLGADDGIGVAYQMALLEDNTLQHGPIECLFTVDEEVGLLGAHVLRKDWITSKYLVNLDSEEQGEFCIGCAGGIGTFAEYKCEMEDASSDLFFMNVKVGGLIGGHSGADIDKNRGNAIKILAELLRTVKANVEVMYIADIDGGNLHNAIPREARATIAVKTKDKEKVRVQINLLDNLVQQMCSDEEKAVVELESADKQDKVISLQDTENILSALSLCPHGVEGMSEDMPGLVETSTNLASIKKQGEGVYLIETSQRSSDEEKKEKIRMKVMMSFVVSGSKNIYCDEGYPGWKPNINSRIKDIAVETYKQLFGVEPKVGAIHAGLECGLFINKYPNLDMISVGPTIIGNHSPAERVKIDTVEMTWKHVLKIIEEVMRVH